MPARRWPRLCFLWVLLILCPACFPLFELFHDKRVVPWQQELACAARGTPASQQERPERGERRFD
eukprot:165160-Prorocentrum_lima.AAC.1